MSDRGAIWVGESPEAVHREVADRLWRFLSRLRSAAAGPFRLALSGGSTPRRLYEILSSPGFGKTILWHRVHLFFADERCVPADHPESNFGLVRAALLDRLSQPPAKVFRMEGEASDPAEAARRYEEAIRSDFGRQASGMDLVLLGVGADGHTASLFPGADSLEEERRWVLATDPPGEGGRRRMTLTLPLLNESTEVWFLATGQAKAAILARIHGEGGADLPAGRVRARPGQVTWFLDRAASSRLEK